MTANSLESAVTTITNARDFNEIAALLCAYVIVYVMMTTANLPAQGWHAGCPRVSITTATTRRLTRFVPTGSPTLNTHWISPLIRR